VCIHCSDFSLVSTFTALQQYWGVDGRCQNVAELTGCRLLWHRYTKTYSLI
jgi:hypothetical protein